MERHGPRPRPRCSKSRKTLQLIHNKKLKVEIIEYYKFSLNYNELKSILEKLKMNPIDLIRKQESIWKKKYKNQKLSDREIIDVMIENPQIMERPIVIKENKAIIGRPPENVLSLIN